MLIYWFLGKKKDQLEPELGADEPAPPIEIDITVEMLTWKSTDESVQHEE